MFLNNNLRVWPFKYFFRLINDIYNHRQFILSNSAKCFGLYVQF